MKKSRYSEAQIVSVLKEAESGVPVSELCRTHGMSSAAFYQWRSKYGGMDASLISEMKQLQAENARLKRMFADVAMQNETPKLYEYQGKSQFLWGLYFVLNNNNIFNSSNL